MSANADQYIIKDGKIADGVEILAYPSDNPGDTAINGTAPDGTDAVVVSHKYQYNDVRFYVADGIDLNDNFMYEVEYYYPAGTIDSSHWSGKRPAMYCGLVSDTTGGNYSVDAAFTLLVRDCKIKSAGDEWKTESELIYAHPTKTSAKLFTFGWQREVDMTGVATERPVYIKNLRFFGNGNKPFFAESFDNLGAVYSEKVTNVERYTLKGGVATLYAKSTAQDASATLTSGLPIYTENTGTAASAHVHGLRLYEDDATDGSEFYDDEIYRGMNILNDGTRKGSRTFFFVPTAGLAGTNINFSYIAKWDASKSKTETFTSETDPDSIHFVFSYAYVDDPAAISETTTAIDTLLAGEWTKYEGQIPLNTASKYLAICFTPNETFSYCVDNIVLTSDGCSVTGATIDDATPFAINAYTVKTGVSKLSADSKLSIYPNPTTGILNVANEGVKSVAVYSLSGAVMSQAEGASINVSNLAKGVYVVKAFTNNGVIVGSIIKK